jgi:beta-glucosidase
LDRLAAATRDFCFNHYFIRAAKQGGLVFPGRRALDFIGLNYYSRNYIRRKDLGFPGVFGELCNNAHHPETSHVNALGWEIYPNGLYELLKSFGRYKLPLIVSENGICTADDAERTRFIEAHVDAMKRAMKDGAPVIGYLYWSLLDNFEWADGYTPRFGLVEVDYATQKRTPRSSAMRFAEICLEQP